MCLYLTYVNIFHLKYYCNQSVLMFKNNNNKPRESLSVKFPIEKIKTEEYFNLILIFYNY